MSSHSNGYEPAYLGMIICCEGFGGPLIWLGEENCAQSPLERYAVADTLHMKMTNAAIPSPSNTWKSAPRGCGSADRLGPGIVDSLEPWTFALYVPHC
jgi:hypothetical protein